MKQRYTSRALAQFEGLNDYLARRSTVGALSVVASLRATMARLVILPHLGRRTDQSNLLIFVEPDYGYRIFYRIDDETVTVVRILQRSQR